VECVGCGRRSSRTGIAREGLCWGCWAQEYYRRLEPPAREADSTTGRPPAGATEKERPTDDQDSAGPLLRRAIHGGQRRTKEPRDAPPTAPRLHTGPARGRGRPGSPCRGAGGRDRLARGGDAGAAPAWGGDPPSEGPPGHVLFVWGVQPHPRRAL